MTKPIETTTPWRIANWARAVGISRAGFYLIPTDCLPRLVKIGTRTIILEEPADWLERMAQRGGVPAARRG